MTRGGEDPKLQAKPRTAWAFIGPWSGLFNPLSLTIISIVDKGGVLRRVSRRYLVMGADGCKGGILQGGQSEIFLLNQEFALRQKS